MNAHHQQHLTDSSADDMMAAELSALVERAHGPFAVQSFMDGGARLYDRQRKALSAEETAHATAKAALVDKYRARLSDLRHEADEALRKLEDEHGARMAAGQRILEALDGLRRARSAS